MMVDAESGLVTIKLAERTLPSSLHRVKFLTEAAFRPGGNGDPSRRVITAFRVTKRL